MSYRSNKLPRYILMDTYGRLFSSNDLITWEQSKGRSGNNNFAFTYGDGLIVAISGKSIYTSSDGGLTWVAKSANNSYLWNIAYGGGQFIAVSQGGQISYSSDGYNWSVLSGMLPSSLIVYASKTWVFAEYKESGQIYTSTDGAKWELRTKFTDSGWWRDAVYGAGAWVMVGYQTSASSLDGGITWVEHKIPSGRQFWGVAYGDGVFISVGDNGSIFSSTNNGITWQAESSNVTNLLTSIKYCNSVFVITMDGGSILYSEDKGKTWLNTKLITSADYRSLICTDTK